MTRPSLRFSIAFALATAAAACAPKSRPEAGGQTNWLLACTSSDQCGDLECICGACTAPCDDDAACGDLPSAFCAAASDDGSTALCGGRPAPSALCLPQCEQPCGEGDLCVAGKCTPADDGTVRMTIDTAERHQTLAGFGASLAYAEDAIAAHPDKAELYDLLFAESGIDVLRLRNRYEGGNAAELRSAAEIIAAASQRLGRKPLVFMTSGSPPAALKANGSRICAGDRATCTLASRPAGGFDYDAFARHWRASLEAHADVGIVPDYVSIQNNPNWVPEAARPNEACRFLPEEGTATVLVDGAPVEVAYPGYRNALEAVRAAIADLPFVPRLSAPEVTHPDLIGDYVPRLDASGFDALALHLYGVDASAIAASALSSVRDLAGQLARPVFQTEMQAEGLETAVLIHHAVTAGGASAYLQNDIVSLTPAGAPVALALLTRDRFEAQGPYYALAHYAKHTDPGWIRVGASSDSSEILGSAWLSPDGRVLTVVLVNPGSEDRNAELVLDDALRPRLVRAEVTRTIFDGAERLAALGDLPPSGAVRVPSRSIVTAALAFE